MIKLLCSYKLQNLVPDVWSMNAWEESMSGKAGGFDNTQLSSVLDCKGCSQGLINTPNVSRAALAKADRKAA